MTSGEVPARTVSGDGGAPRSTPRRLGAAERRAQLVAAGLALARSGPLDTVTADTVAQSIGVSKALVFHYFPTNRDLQVAVMRGASDELLAAVELEPTGDPYTRLRSGLESFVTSISQYPSVARSVVRSAGSDPQMVEVFEELRVAIVDLIAETLGTAPLLPGMRLAVRGWIAMAEEMILSWTDDPVIGREQLVSYLHTAAFALLPSALALDEAGDEAPAPSGPDRTPAS